MSKPPEITLELLAAYEADTGDSLTADRLRADIDHRQRLDAYKTIEKEWEAANPAPPFDMAALFYSGNPTDRWIDAKLEAIGESPTSPRRTAEDWPPVDDDIGRVLAAVFRACEENRDG